LFKIEIGIDGLKAAHEELMKALEGEISQHLKFVGNQAAFNASRSQDIGGSVLKNSVSYRLVSPFRLKIFTKKKHASYLNDGTKPHVIRPRRKKALRFVTGGGEVRFAKKVNHPGNKATHWFDNAIEKAITESKDELRASLEKIGNAKY